MLEKLNLLRVQGLVRNFAYIISITHKIFQYLTENIFPSIFNQAIRYCNRTTIALRKSFKNIKKKKKGVADTFLEDRQGSWRRQCLVPWFSSVPTLFPSMSEKSMRINIFESSFSKAVAKHPADYQWQSRNRTQSL